MNNPSSSEPLEEALNEIIRLLNDGALIRAREPGSATWRWNGYQVEVSGLHIKMQEKKSK